MNKKNMNTSFTNNKTNANQAGPLNTAAKIVLPAKKYSG